jgi:hypothetical protein
MATAGAVQCLALSAKYENACTGFSLNQIVCGFYKPELQLMLKKEREAI